MSTVHEIYNFQAGTFKTFKIFQTEICPQGPAYDHSTQLLSCISLSCLSGMNAAHWWKPNFKLLKAFLKRKSASKTLQNDHPAFHFPSFSS